MDTLSTLARKPARKSAGLMSSLAQDQPNNASAEALGDNWKSALCVTSLYDSYVAVQHENESLREQVRQLQHANELLQVEARSATKGRHPEAEMDGDESQLVKEIRLLRAEKSQQELLFEKRRGQLETQLTEFKALYHEQVEKYQQRFDLDPNEPKRVAMSTLTLQNTLDQVVRDKEELALQHGRLQKMYHSLEQQTHQSVEGLRAKVAELEGKRVAQATHRVRTVLEKWVFARLAHSWKQWRLVVLSDRLLSRQLREQQAQRADADSKRQQYTTEQAARFIVKILQSATRRCFAQWKQVANAQRTRRRLLDQFNQRQQTRTLKESILRWKLRHRSTTSVRTGALRLTAVVERHSKSRAWRRWVIVPLQASIQYHRRQHESILSHVRSLTEKLDDTQANYDAIYAAHASLVDQMEQSTVDHSQQVLAHTADQEVTQLRVADIVARRTQRLQYRRVLVAWRIVARGRVISRRKIQRLRRDHSSRLLQRVVAAWRVNAHRQHRLGQVTRNVMQRMRLLGAYRCFLAWREFVVLKKERVETLDRVIRHMKNQQLLKCFTTWTDYRRTRRDQRQQLRTMCVIVERVHLASLFSHWKRALVVMTKEAESIKRQQIEAEWQHRLEQSKLELKQLRVYFLKWQTTIASGKKYRHLTRKCAIKWQNDVLVKCLEEWKVYAARCVTRRDQLRRLVVRRVGRDLQGAWSRWRTQAAVKAKQLEVIRLEQQRDALVLRLEQELVELRMQQAAETAQSAERALILDTHLQQTQMELHNTQASYVKYKHALTAVCWSIHQRRNLALSVRAWRGVVVETRRRRVAVEMMRKQALVRAQRDCFTGWNGVRLKRLKITTAMTQLLKSWRRHVSSLCLTAWRRYASRRRSIRILARDYNRKVHDRLCHVVFGAWQQDSRATGVLRRTLEQIWLASVHARMQHYLSKWTEFTSAARIHDQLRRKELAIAAIQARVCSRWTAGTLKTVFAAWRAGVHDAKRVQLGAQRLCKLRSAVWMHFAFAGWRCLHERVQEQRKWLAEWQRKQDTASTEAAWQQWKELTVSKRIEELQLLQLDKITSQAAIVQSTEQIEQLVGKNNELLSQLDKLTLVQSKESESVAHLAMQLTVSRWFYRWSQWARSAKLLRARVCRLQCHQLLNTKRFALYAWTEAIAMKYEQEQQAADAQRRLIARQLRAVLTAWAQYSRESRRIKAQLRRLQRKRDAHEIALRFQSWTEFRTHNQAARRLLTLLTRCADQVALADRFRAWKQATQFLRKLSVKEAERQRRILAFMMDKHESTLANYFSMWKACGHRRHQRLQRVEALAAQCRRRCLRVYWQCLVDSIAADRQQVTGFQSIQRIWERHQLRVALRRWLRQVQREKEEVLRQQTLALSQEKEAMHHELATKTTQIVALMTTVSELEVAKEALQSSMNQALSTTQLSLSSRVREAMQRLVLMKLLARTAWVSRDTYDLATRFHQWKLQAIRQRSRVAAMRRCAQLIAKKRVAQTLFVWKRRVLLDKQYDSWTSKQRRVICSCAWTQWRRFVIDRRARRQRFLVRWIDSTLTAKHRAAAERRVASCFQLWRSQTALVAATAQLQMTVEAQQSIQREGTVQRRRALMTKWLWRSYHTRCGDLRLALSLWRGMGIYLPPSSKKEPASTRQLIVSPAVAGSDTSVIVKIVQDLQLLFRRLAAARSISELCDAVSASFSQLSLGRASAVLFLLDPTRNELWTRPRDSQQVVRSAASLGIAGATVSCPTAPLVVENATQDARFHPLVDHLAVAGVAHLATAVDTSISLFSASVVAADGSVYGVLQVAYAVSTASPPELSPSLQFQVLGRACCFFVEQLLHEMVRHCRDPVRARAPDSFAKLFKQNKNWRKYFVQVEKEAQRTQQQLQELLAEQDELLQERERLQVQVQRVQHEREALAHDQQAKAQDTQQHELLIKHLAAYKKKALKLKETLVETEKRLEDKAKDLERVRLELDQLRREARAKQLQAMITAASEAISPTKAKTTTDTDDTEHDDLYQHHESATSSSHKLQLLRGAEVATLKNELVRAESDSLFLVKAVDVATRHHGELPDSLKMEVNRIALRLKKPPRHASN